MGRSGRCCGCAPWSVRLSLSRARLGRDVASGASEALEQFGVIASEPRLSLFERLYKQLHIATVEGCRSPRARWA
jgi:hypothetical protein